MPQTPPPFCALVVDDDPNVRMLASAILEDAGYSTEVAENGDEALAILAIRHPSISLLFTDVQMPGSIDGFALARATFERWPHISVVVASGHVTPAPDDLPATATFIGKPFNEQIVRDRLSDMLPEEKKPPPLAD